jgi:hypothetical protein
MTTEKRAQRRLWPRRARPDEVHRRLFAAYRQVLRRAVDVGWRTALDDYAREAEEAGRAVDDVEADVEVFEQVDLAERLKGIDPIVAQKRRDVYLMIATPIALIGGVIVTGLMAEKGFGVLASVGVGGLAAVLGRQLSAMLTTVLVRR